MSDLQVRLPSKSEAASSCILCARPPARVLSLRDESWGSVTRFCALHYEDLGRRVNGSQLTYEERMAHGVVKEDSE